MPNRRHALALLGLGTFTLPPMTTHAKTPTDGLADSPTAGFAHAAPVNSLVEAPTDPYLWLEEVDSEAALNWVRARNQACRAVLEARPGFASTRASLLEVLDDQQRIPAVARRGRYLYNFWRDAQHPRGLWRRTTFDAYLQPEPTWELLLDLDALAQAEGENWVWSRSVSPGGDSPRCLILLSRGGADAVVLREFDLDTRQFVPDGFALPEAKTDVDWLDEHTLLVGTDTGPGSLTSSGYARQLRRWRRGQTLADAPVMFEAEASDVAAFGQWFDGAQPPRLLLGRSPDFFTNQTWWWDGQQAQAIAKPDDVQLSFWADQVLLSLRKDWTVDGHTWPSGSLLAAPAEAFLRGERQGLQAVFTPSASRSLQGYATTARRLVLNLLDNVAHRVEIAELDPTDPSRGWQRHPLALPFPGTLRVQSLHDPLVPHDPLAERLFISYTDFLTPDSLLMASVEPAPAGTPAAPVQTLKSRRSFFDAAGLKVVQHFARSADGTSVPYFIVWPRQPRSDGQNPTLLYGYGGFEVSMEPWYLAGNGRAWLGQGGVFVLANIRGGGEFGPAWHQAATKAHKQRSYDDFIAVAEDLIRQGVTTPAHLGIQGGSNGGLLVGAVMVQRPELFNAVVCQVPLLDMRRYHRLLAGASWMGEYGNPDDPADWDFIRRYSPYQNVRAERPCPPLLLVTSTRDDRVHPAHARKMAARMLEQGHRVLYHENIEGGHGGGADNSQHADRQALEYAFLWQQLGHVAQ